VHTRTRALNHSHHSLKLKPNQTKRTGYHKAFQELSKGLREQDERRQRSAEREEERDASLADALHAHEKQTTGARFEKRKRELMERMQEEVKAKKYRVDIDGTPRPVRSKRGKTAAAQKAAATAAAKADHLSFKNIAFQLTSGEMAADFDAMSRPPRAVGSNKDVHCNVLPGKEYFQCFDERFRIGDTIVCVKHDAFDSTHVLPTHTVRGALMSLSEHHIHVADKAHNQDARVPLALIRAGQWHLSRGVAE
jgi:hypothetical protein